MHKRGFTLIELLTVVAIIGILASIILVSLNSAQAKGRDAKRVADIRTIQLSLEQYYSDNGSYPVDIYAATNSLSPTYISVMPKDPNGSNYLYVAFCNGTAPIAYHLGAWLEQATNSALSQAVHQTSAPNSLAVCSGPNAEFNGQTCNQSTGACYDVTN